jgi:Nuclease-related domain
MIGQGYQVFHDIPFTDWNIDHVAVGPRGVFAIETKTRRKPPLKKDQKHEVIFDGERLIWLNKWTEVKPVAQARSNAKSLGKWLEKAAGERVEVIPVLAIPGWWLTIRKYGDVAAYSATGMSEHLPKRGTTDLLPAQVQRIAFQLRKLCEVNSG